MTSHWKFEFLIHLISNLNILFLVCVAESHRTFEITHSAVIASALYGCGNGISKGKWWNFVKNIFAIPNFRVDRCDLELFTSVNKLFFSHYSTNIRNGKTIFDDYFIHTYNEFQYENDFSVASATKHKINTNKFKFHFTQKRLLAAQMFKFVGRLIFNLWLVANGNVNSTKKSHSFW